MAKQRAKKIKKEKMTISGSDLTRRIRTPYRPEFKSGRHLTEKDRPRKKIKPRDYRENE